MIVSVVEMGAWCEGLLKIAKASDVATDAAGRYSGFVRRAMAEDTISSRYEGLVRGIRQRLPILWYRQYTPIDYGQRLYLLTSPTALMYNR